MQLKPLKAVKTVKTDFWTFDLETESLEGIKFVLGALYRPEFRKKEERTTLFHSMDEVFSFLCEYARSVVWKKAGRYKNIFIHNLTFDIRFFLEYVSTRPIECKIVHLASGSKDLVVELHLGEFRFRFVDSYQLTLLGQAELEETLFFVTSAP